MFERLTAPKVRDTEQRATTILQKSLSVSGTYRNNGLLGEVLPACVSEPYKDPIGALPAHCEWLLVLETRVRAAGRVAVTGHPSQPLGNAPWFETDSDAGVCVCAGWVARVPVGRHRGGATSWAQHAWYGPQARQGGPGHLLLLSRARTCVVRQGGASPHAASGWGGSPLNQHAAPCPRPSPRPVDPIAL